MKRIHFDNLGKNNFWIILILLSVIFIIAGVFKPFKIENEKVYDYISACGFLFQAIYFSRLFWHKNTVQWNDKGAVIKINSILGKNIIFSNVKKSELNENKLTITYKQGKKVTFELKEFVKADIQKLNEIITKNTIANTVY
tara:strand:+ start:241 stop:663 length:423 start_codon:yes stop_codon:yes gene_type:complete